MKSFALHWLKQELSLISIPNQDFKSILFSFETFTVKKENNNNNNNSNNESINNKTLIPSESLEVTKIERSNKNILKYL